MNKTKLGVLLGGTVLLVALVFLGPLRFLDSLFYDLNFAFAPAPASDSVVVVGIDIRSIGEVGSWPWPRATTARLIKRINACKPRAVALDMLFPRSEDLAASESLAVAFEQTPRLVLPFRAGEVSAEPTEGGDVPPDVFAKRFMVVRNQPLLERTLFYNVKHFATLDSMFSRHADYGGYVNVSTSNTSQKLREAVHVMRAGQEYYPSFGLAAVAAYYGLEPSAFALDADGPVVMLGDRPLELSSYAASAFINFRSDRSPVIVVSAADVLSGKVDPARLAGKLVFVGITDAGAGADFFTTPVRSQFPGVEVWATVAGDILESAWVRWGGGTLAIGNWILVLILFPGLALLVPSSRKPLAVAGGLVLAAGSVGGGIYLFGAQHYFWNPANHLYAWVFSILWLAAQKANPVLGESTAIRLEPTSEDEGDIKAAATPQDYIKVIPRTDTMTYVVRKLAPQVFQSTQPVAVPAQVFEQIRQLSGGYVIGTLGSGGMADVYLIWHPRLEMYRAVKVIKPGQSQQLLERFETEIKVFSKFNHPNIVTCYGVGEWHGLPTVEMEFVHGTSLEGVLKKKGPVSVPQALAMIILTCRALQHAHTQVMTLYGQTHRGLVHRDIKPANIMLSRSGRIKLADFGIARPGAVSLHTIDAGQVVGTLPYLAPEQLDENGQLTPRTDLYALGATLYELIAGARAFPQRDITTLIKAKTFGTVEKLKPSPLIPELLVKTLDKVMSLEPEQRHASAEEFGADLEQCLRVLKVTDGYAQIRALVDEFFAAQDQKPQVVRAPGAKNPT